MLNSSKRFGDLLNSFFVGVLFGDLLGVPFVFEGYFFPTDPFKMGLSFVGVIFAIFFSGVTCTMLRTFLGLGGTLMLSFRQDTSISSSIFITCVLTICISFAFLSCSGNVESVSSNCFLFLWLDVLGEVLFELNTVLFECCRLLVATALVLSFLLVPVKNDEIFWFSLIN